MVTGNFSTALPCFSLFFVCFLNLQDPILCVAFPSGTPTESLWSCLLGRWPTDIKAVCSGVSPLPPFFFSPQNAPFLWLFFKEKDSSNEFPQQVLFGSNIDSIVVLLMLFFLFLLQGSCDRLEHLICASRLPRKRGKWSSWRKPAPTAGTVSFCRFPPNCN